MADLTRQQVESLAYVMQFLYELGFDLRTVKRAADAWWKVKAKSSTAGVVDIGEQQGFALRKHLRNEGIATISATDAALARALSAWLLEMKNAAGVAPAHETKEKTQ